MEQTTAEVTREMEDARQELDQDLAELTVRAKSAVDWREQVGKRPMAALGAALVGGFLLAGVTRRRSPRNDGALPWPVSGIRNGNGRPRRSANRGPVAGALVAVASTALAKMLGEMIPGFRDEHTKRTPVRDHRDD